MNNSTVEPFVAELPFIQKNFTRCISYFYEMDLVKIFNTEIQAPKTAIIAPQSLPIGPARLMDRSA